jgi:hypothetical protein
VTQLYKLISILSLLKCNNSHVITNSSIALFRWACLPPGFRGTGSPPVLPSCAATLDRVNRLRNGLTQADAYSHISCVNLLKRVDAIFRTEKYFSKQLTFQQGSCNKSVTGELTRGTWKLGLGAEIVSRRMHLGSYFHNHNAFNLIKLI